MMKKAIKYHLFEMRKAILIYYGIMLMILILLGGLVGIQTNNGSIGGMEFSTAIFIFIAALNSFTESFKMFLQNGLSRKTLFYSYAASTVIISIFMAFISSISAIVMDIFFINDPLFLQTYGTRYLGEGTAIIQIIEGFLWTSFLYMLMAMLGYFVRLLYYRMNTKLRVLVSVGVPAFWIVGLPFIEYNWTNGRISQGMVDFFAYAFGLANGYNPYYFMVTAAITLIILGALSYGLVRKAVVKTA